MFSCEKSDSNETGQPELPSSSLPASFTATVTGGFGDEVTSQNLLSGNKGVLFMEGTDGAKEVFNAWLEGNDNPGCKVSNRCTVQSNGTIEAVIQGLSPETTYSYALFFKTGKKRYLGGSGTFTTKSFKPVLNTGEAADIRYWDARIDGSFENLDKLDASMFTQGVMLALDDSFNDEATFKTFKLDEYSPKFSLQANGLEAGRKYYYRTFIKSEDMDLACYGPVKSFNSKSLDEMAVDMGLSVKWANCDLGEQEYVQYNSNSDMKLFSWGCTQPVATSTLNIPKDRYKYWDASSNSYIDIGSQISGTEYDAARAILGGKWRMPTKEEMDELLACETKTIIKDETIEKFTIVGPSGNSIDFFNMYYWTGDMGEDNKPWEMMGLGLPESGHHITNLFSPQERAQLIRPVCDY
ncbi:MAG: hypothetical protein IK006_03530 [Bacteroidaceae bacterium]|nr:hypothetical protein [Bacteroidaceae bacterium]